MTALVSALADAIPFLALAGAVLVGAWTVPQLRLAYVLLLSQAVDANTIEAGSTAVVGVAEPAGETLEDDALVTRENGSVEAVPFVVETPGGDVRVDPAERTDEGPTGAGLTVENATLDLPGDGAGGHRLAAGQETVVLGVASNTGEFDDGPPVIENRDGRRFQLLAGSSENAVKPYALRAVAGTLVAFTLLVVALFTLP